MIFCNYNKDINFEFKKLFNIEFMYKIKKIIKSLNNIFCFHLF